MIPKLVQFRVYKMNKLSQMAITPEGCHNSLRLYQGARSSYLQLLHSYQP
jgi:hypothetical protein